MVDRFTVDMFHPQSGPLRPCRFCSCHIDHEGYVTLILLAILLTSNVVSEIT